MPAPINVAEAKKPDLPPLGPLPVFGSVVTGGFAWPPPEVQPTEALAQVPCPPGGVPAAVQQIKFASPHGFWVPLLQPHPSAGIDESVQKQVLVPVPQLPSQQSLSWVQESPAKAQVPGGFAPPPEVQPTEALVQVPCPPGGVPAAVQQISVLSPHGFCVPELQPQPSAGRDESVQKQVCVSVPQLPSQQSLSDVHESPANAQLLVGLQPTEALVQVPGPPGVLDDEQQSKVESPQGFAVPVTQLQPSAGRDSSLQKQILVSVLQLPWQQSLSVEHEPPAWTHVVGPVPGGAEALTVPGRVTPRPIKVPPAAEPASPLSTWRRESPRAKPRVNSSNRCPSIRVPSFANIPRLPELS